MVGLNQGTLATLGYITFISCCASLPKCQIQQQLMWMMKILLNLAQFCIIWQDIRLVMLCVNELIFREVCVYTWPYIWNMHVYINNTLYLQLIIGQCKVVIYFHFLFWCPVFWLVFLLYYNNNEFCSFAKEIWCRYDVCNIYFMLKSYSDFKYSTVLIYIFIKNIIQVKNI